MTTPEPAHAVIVVRRDNLDELEALAKAASQTEWQLGHTGTATLDDAVRWMEDTIRKRDSPDIWLVFIGQVDAEGGTLTTAYTGNGPTSEANARYITAVQPSYIRTIIYVLRKLMGDKTAIVVPWEREEEATDVHH